MGSDPVRSGFLTFSSAAYLTFADQPFHEVFTAVPSFFVAAWDAVTAITNIEPMQRVRDNWNRVIKGAAGELVNDAERVPQSRTAGNPYKIKDRETRDWLVR